MKTTGRCALEGSSWLSVWWESIAGNPYSSHSCCLLSLLSRLVCHVHWNQSAWTAPTVYSHPEQKGLQKKYCKRKLAGKSKMEGCISRRKQRIQINDNDAATFSTEHHIISRGYLSNPIILKIEMCGNLFLCHLFFFENDGMECLGWCF